MGNFLVLRNYPYENLKVNQSMFVFLAMAQRTDEETYQPLLVQGNPFLSLQFAFSTNTVDSRMREVRTSLPDPC